MGFKIESLMEVIDDYLERLSGGGKKKGTVMVSYVLLSGVNDTLEHACQLRDLVLHRSVIVNLIPYNAFDGNSHGYEFPSDDRVDAFLTLLVDAGIRVFQRRHHGRDIGA